MIIGKADDKNQAGQATIKRKHALTVSVGLSNICYTFAVKTIGNVLVRRFPAEWAHRSVVVLSIVSL